MKIIGPDPEAFYPRKDDSKLVFLKKFVKASNIFVGDYTYFDDRRYGPENLKSITSYITTIFPK
jgi:virginiamycin A acetyltransferase